MSQQSGFITTGRSMSQDPRVGLSQIPFSQILQTQPGVAMRINPQQYPPQYNQQALTMIKGSQQIPPFILQQQQQNSQTFQNSVGFVPPTRVVTRHMTVIPLTAQNNSVDNSNTYNNSQDNNNKNTSNSNHNLQTILNNNSQQNQQFIRSVSHHHLTTIPTSSRTPPLVTSTQSSIHLQQKQQPSISGEERIYLRQNSDRLLSQSQLSQHQQTQQSQLPKIQQFPSFSSLLKDDSIHRQQQLQVIQQPKEQLESNKQTEITDESRNINKSTPEKTQNAIPSSDHQLIGIPQISLQSSLITGYFPNSQESSRVMLSSHRQALLDSSNNKQDINNNHKDNQKEIETANFIGEAVYTPERTQSEKKSYTPIDQLFDINTKSDSQQLRKQNLNEDELNAIQNDYPQRKQVEIFETNPILNNKQTGIENISMEHSITNIMQNSDIRKETTKSLLKSSQIDGILNNNPYPNSYKPIPLYIPHYPSSQQIQIPNVTSPSSSPLIANFSLELHKMNSNPISHQQILLKPILRADSFPLITEKPNENQEGYVNHSNGSLMNKSQGTTTIPTSNFHLALSTQPALTNLFADQISKQNGNENIASPNRITNYEQIYSYNQSQYDLPGYKQYESNGKSQREVNNLTSEAVATTTPINFPRLPLNPETHITQITTTSALNSLQPSHPELQQHLSSPGTSPTSKRRYLPLDVIQEDNQDILHTDQSLISSVFQFSNKKQLPPIVIRQQNNNPFIELQPGITQDNQYSPLKPVILDTADALRKSQKSLSNIQENYETIHSYSPAKKDKNEEIIDLVKSDSRKNMLIQENERIDKLLSSQKVITITVIEQGDEIIEPSGQEMQGYNQEVQLVEEEQDIEPVLSQQAQIALRNQNGGWSPEAAEHEEVSESEEEALGDVVQLQQLISQKTDQIRAQIESLQQSRKNQHRQQLKSNKGFQVDSSRKGELQQDEGHSEEEQGQECDDEDDGAALTLADIEMIIDEKMGQLVEKLKRKRSRKRSVNDCNETEKKQKQSEGDQDNKSKVDHDDNGNISESSEGQQQVINLYGQKRIEKNRLLFLKSQGSMKKNKQSDLDTNQKGVSSNGGRLHHSKSQKDLETIDKIHDNDIIQQLLHHNNMDDQCGSVGQIVSTDSNQTTTRQSQYHQSYSNQQDERKIKNGHTKNNGDNQPNGKSNMKSQMNSVKKEKEQKQFINLLVHSKGQHSNQLGQNKSPNSNIVRNQRSNSQNNTNDSKKRRKNSGYVSPFEESAEKQKNNNFIRQEDQNSNHKQNNHQTPTKSAYYQQFSSGNNQNSHLKKSILKDDKEKIVDLYRMKGMVVVEKKKQIMNNNGIAHSRQSSQVTGKITNISSSKKPHHARVNSAVFGNTTSKTSIHNDINRSSDIIDLQSSTTQNLSSFHYLKKISSKERLRDINQNEQRGNRSSSREKYDNYLHQHNSSRGEEYISRSFHSPGRQQQGRSSSREQLSSERKRELEDSKYLIEKKRQEDQYVKDIQRQIEQQEKMLLSSKQASKTTWNSNSILNIKKQSMKTMTKSASKDSLGGFKTRGEYLYQIALVQNQRQKELKKLRQEQERKLQEIECTFSPSLVTSSASRNKSPGSFFDRQDQWDRERQLKKNKLQDSSSAEKIRECTFRPELFSRIDIAKDNIFVQQFHRQIQKFSEKKNIPVSTNNSSQSPTLSRSSGFQLNNSQNHNKRSPQTVRSEKSRLLSQEENNYFTAINSKTSKFLSSTLQQFSRKEMNSEESKKMIKVQIPQEFNVAKEISDYRLAVEKLNQQKANTLLSDLHFSQQQ